MSGTRVASATAGRLCRSRPRRAGQPGGRILGSADPTGGGVSGLGTSVGTGRRVVDCSARTNYEFHLIRDSEVFRYRIVALATLSLYLDE